MNIPIWFLAGWVTASTLTYVFHYLLFKKPPSPLDWFIWAILYFAVAMI